jgi:hypothetical protein
MMQKIVYWGPRLLGIGAILFMMIFSLDCFDEGNSIGNVLICFLMHNIPAFICLAALIVAWKWELVGGIFFVLIFIAGTIFFKSFTGNLWSLLVISPLLLTGILFIVYHYTQKPKTSI